ncbi:hypothetical protein HU200_053873 [Digitaria exilis]|uniref:Uncharacterized protein n=1 Tax=Digitaria exilis TaxID=1010633 RepID=A0A835AWI7_9POAL|nr:hypothetical protein HU200_053873 [Digitaria exilis]
MMSRESHSAFPTADSRVTSRG